MRVLGLDFETTGFDTSQERITEIGAVVWDVEGKRPLVTYGVFLYDESYKPRLSKEVLDMMGRVCGITQAMLEEFGLMPVPQFQWLERTCQYNKIDYIVAHNGENFDKPLLVSELNRNGIEAPHLRAVPWIDTRTDLPFAQEPDSRKLKHLAVDHGFINPFAHRAVFDVLTMLRVMSNYPIEDILKYQAIPWITVRAVVSFTEKDLAKAQRFSWEKIGDKTYPKFWVKRIKADKLAQEKEACKGFEVVRIE